MRALPLQRALKLSSQNVRSVVVASPLSKQTSYSKNALVSYASSTNSVATDDNKPSTSAAAATWEIKMLYDGDCPLCMREVEMLQRRDAGRNNIAFVDIADPNFNPDDHAGISYEAAMERIHAVLPDGTIVKNVEVFRRLYEAVGLGWVYSVTKFPAVESLANGLYDVWAKYRLPLTGRPSDLSVILQQKEKSCAAIKQQE